mgnify:CR=1 FL=1
MDPSAEPFSPYSTPLVFHSVIAKFLTARLRSHLCPRRVRAPASPSFRAGAALGVPASHTTHTKGRTRGPSWPLLASPPQTFASYALPLVSKNKSARLRQLQRSCHLTGTQYHASIVQDAAV